MKNLISTKSGFSEGVLNAADINEHVIVLGTDITTSVGLDILAKKYPERFISIGIAEQNAVGIAAGLALSGKIPVFATYAVFSAMRTTDQIRISVCYNNLHVIIGGAHAGISVGPDGATHQALEDIAMMRSLPNLTVLSPCDATQARILTTKAITDCKGPVYIRFGREAVPDFTEEQSDTVIGKAQILRKGKEASIIATGHMVWPAILAAKQLEQEGIDVRVINMHTIKPIDFECIINAAKETGYILSVEEHQIAGGLGSAISEVVVKHHPVPMDMIGMNDCFGESGKPEELLEKYGLTSNAIITRLRRLMESFPR